MQYSNWGGGSWITLSFYTRGDLTPTIPTCDIKEFDKKVTLPPVKLSDLMSAIPGRYSNLTNTFNIALECKDKPKVSVKFDGVKMTGIPDEDVLANRVSGNENMGIQILFNSTPVKIGDVFHILNSTQTQELLTFNVYYYYKGGGVQSGAVQSQSEFTFTYQ